MSPETFCYRQRYSFELQRRRPPCYLIAAAGICEFFLEGCICFFFWKTTVRLRGFAQWTGQCPLSLSPSCLFVCCFWLFVERRLLEGFVHHLLISPAAGARPHCCQFLGQQPHSWAGYQAEQPLAFFQDHKPSEKEGQPWLKRRAFERSN